MLFIARNDYNHEILFEEAISLKEAKASIFNMCEQVALEGVDNGIESDAKELFEDWSIEEVKSWGAERCESIALSVLNETNNLWTGFYICDTNEVDQELANDFYSDDFDLYRVGNSDEVLFLRRA